MSRVKQKHTAPEMIVRRYLYSKGIRYRIHLRSLPGSPDIAIPKQKLVIFIHGCFWHGHQHCKKSYWPKNNLEFWNKKIDNNRAKDIRNINDLKALGWSVIIVWECDLKKAYQQETLQNVINQISMGRLKS